MNSAPQESKSPFDGDLILGAVNIATYIFSQFIEGTAGDEREKAIARYRRKVYHLAETSRLPIFRLGTTLAARKSALQKFVEDQEKRTSSNVRGLDDGESRASST